MGRRRARRSTRRVQRRLRTALRFACRADSRTRRRSPFKPQMGGALTGFAISVRVCDDQRGRRPPLIVARQADSMPQLFVVRAFPNGAPGGVRGRSASSLVSRLTSSALPLRRGPRQRGPSRPPSLRSAPARRLPHGSATTSRSRSGKSRVPSEATSSGRSGNTGGSPRCERGSAAPSIARALIPRPPPRLTREETPRHE